MVVLVITRYDDPSTVKLMRAGDNILINNTKDWQHVFDMLTALAAHWTRSRSAPERLTTTTRGGAST